MLIMMVMITMVVLIVMVMVMTMVMVLIVTVMVTVMVMMMMKTSARRSICEEFVGGENQVDLGTQIPIWQFNLVEKAIEY